MKPFRALKKSGSIPKFNILLGASLVVVQAFLVALSNFRPSSIVDIVECEIRTLQVIYRYVIRTEHVILANSPLDLNNGKERVKDRIDHHKNYNHFTRKCGISHHNTTTTTTTTVAANTLPISNG
uniref:Uncharacterized protein n=1 Tax=Glossina brevipalpis TaxID=37001 RepID=A0A1A9WNT5_9MUSC